MLFRSLTNQFYALYADIRQRVHSRLCRENSTIAPQEILRCIQKLLDRVLFCTGSKAGARFPPTPETDSSRLPAAAFAAWPC